MKLIDDEVQYQYILTKVACVVKSTSENEVAEITNTEPLALAYPTKKAWVTSELEFDYTALRVIRLENSPSLYPGPRAFIDPESIQAIVCHHAGISYSQLEQAANTWTSFPAITHNVFVRLLDKEFGLVLPVSFNGEVGTKEKEKVQLSGAGIQTKAPRSDFEASAFMAFMPTWGSSIRFFQSDIILTTIMQLTRLSKRPTRKNWLGVCFQPKSFLRALASLLHASGPSSAPSTVSHKRNEREDHKY